MGEREEEEPDERGERGEHGEAHFGGVGRGAVG